MSIEVGAKLPGKVSGITNFGAFIDLGEGKTGLVHISEVSNGFVKDIHDVLTVGDEVTVKVTSVGDDGKIGLSIRKAPEPALMSSFLKDSDDRLSSLKRNTEGKRGGRGGRRG